MVTLDQIAREAGVSQATVSNILNGRNKETWPSAVRRADEVRSIAARLGYQPNGAAKAIATGQFGCIAILLSTQEDVSPLLVDVWAGLHDELSQHDIHIVMFRMPEKKLTDPQQVPKILRELMADGLIVDYTHRIPAHLIQLIEENRLPAVWVNTWRETDCVRPDDVEAAHQMGRHLLSLGHRHITYLDFSHDAADVTIRGERAHDHYSAHDRLHGLHEVLTQGGAQLEVFVERITNFDSCLNFARNLLSSTHSTAIVSQGGNELEPIVLAARDLGFKIPGDFSLIGFGPPKMKVLGQPITSLTVPEREMGHELGRALLRKIAHPTQKFPASVLPFVFDAGATCGPVQNNSSKNFLEVQS